MKLKILKISWLVVLGILLSHVLTVAQSLQLETTVLKRAQQYEPSLLEAAAKHEVDARLLWVIAYLETRFNPRAISHKGARGMMQFMPATAARWGLQHPHDPTAAMDAAARYLRYLQGRFGQQPALLLASYNAGETAVEAYLTGRAIRVGHQMINPARRRTSGLPPYAETQNYVATGMRLLTGNLPTESGSAAQIPSAIKTNPAPEKTKINIASTPRFTTKSITFTRSESENGQPTVLRQRSILYQENSVRQR
jgi:SLT domain-containing protein